MKKIILILYAVITFFSFALITNALSNISINGETLVPIFNKEIYKYNVYTNNEDIYINTVLSEEDSFIEGNGAFKLKEGENKLKLKLTLKDGNIKYYNLSIFLNYKNENDLSNSLLKDLIIKNYKINFDSNVFNYNLNIEDEEQLDIRYEVNNNEKVILEGNSNLKLGNNKIIITVISEDETNKSIYTITVNKTKTVYNEEIKKEKKEIIKNDFDKTDKIIVKIVISLVIIIIITFLFYLFFCIKSKKH